MSCSPSRLIIDSILWTLPVSHVIEKTYANLSLGDTYDCLLTSVSCHSDVVQKLIPSLDSLSFWLDVCFFYTSFNVTVFLGIAANIAIIFVFSTKEIGSSSTNKLLLVLAISDLLSLILYLPMLLSFLFCWVDKTSAVKLSSMINIQVRILINFVSSFSLDTATALSVTRAAAVLYPLRFAIIFSKKRLNIALMCLAIITVSLIAAYLILSETRQVFHPYFNDTITVMTSFTNPKERVLISSLLTEDIVSLTIHVSAVSVTIVKLKSHVKMRAQMTSSNQTAMTVREINMTKMTLVVCLLSIVLFTIATSFKVACIVFLTIAHTFIGPLFTMSCLSLLMTAASSSFNVIVYIKMYHQFKRALCC